MGGEMKGPAAGAPDAKKGEDSPKVEGPKGEPGKTSSTDAKLTSDEIAAIQKLPAAEQTVAQTQLVCPVSEHHLGSMGKPLKTSAEGRTFYLCCKGCEDDLKADPKAVLAKLDKQLASK
jgi:hypothetical protein